MCDLLRICLLLLLVEWRKWRYTTVCLLHRNIRSPPSNISAKGSRSSSSFISFYLFFRSMVVVVMLAYNGTLRENVKVGCFRAPDNPISFFLLFLRWFKKKQKMVIGYICGSCACLRYITVRHLIYSISKYGQRNWSFSFISRDPEINYKTRYLKINFFEKKYGHNVYR